MMGLGCSPGTAPEERESDGVVSHGQESLETSVTPHVEEEAPLVREEEEVDPDDPWGALPELEDSPPAKSRVVSDSSPGDFPSHPRGEPTGRHIPLPSAVWQAGWMNGKPADVGAEVPEGEYGPERPGERVVHLHDPNELPPFLEPGQTLVIHLRELAPDVYVPHAAVTGGTWGRAYRSFITRESTEGRQVQLRWNDRLIWKQGHAPFHALVWGVVPPDEVHPDVNLFSIHNAGTRTVHLDAVWIEPLRLGETPFGVILRNAEWLNKSDSLWVRQALVEVPMPRETEENYELPKIKHSPPSGAADKWERWQDASERFQELVDMEHPHVEVLRSWIPQLREALDRGMVPSVEVNIGHVNKTQCMKAAAYVFGDNFPVWRFPGGPRPAQRATSQLRDRIESPVIFAGGRSKENIMSPFRLDAWRDFDYRYHTGRFRTMFFRGEMSEEEMLSGTTLQYLELQFAPLRAYHHMDRNFHTLDFHKSLVEGLMHSQHTAIVRGGEPGGPFFPDGSDKGDHHWNLLKHVFRFGGPSHRKSHGNLLPSNPHLDLGGSLWAVADNGKDSVHVIIHNPVNRNGTEAALEVPLPWSGPTRVLHHRVATSRGRSTAAEVVSDTSRHEAEPIAGVGREEAEASFRSWFKMGVTLEGMHLLELSPADSPPEPRDIRAPETVGYGALRETNRLFTVSRRPPPPWWARSVAVPHFGAYWTPFGRVSLRVDANASVGDTPDWQALQGFHRAMEGTFPDTSPLQDKSTFFSFPENANETHPFVFATFRQSNVKNADMIGLWIRAHRPAGFDPPPDWSRAVPAARFYMGRLPERQKIEMDYDTWYFISALAEPFRSRFYRHNPRLYFWHDPDTAQHPVLEINAVDAYRLGSEDPQEAGAATLGFIRETDEGRLAVLLLGEPGAKGVWRQRLDRVVETERFHRVIDEALLVTADSPDDPPPEEVQAELSQHKTSRVLEIQVEAMPPAPSPGHLEAIRKHFPLITQRLRQGSYGAVLWVEQEP